MASDSRSHRPDVRPEDLVIRLNIRLKLPSSETVASKVHAALELLAGLRQIFGHGEYWVTWERQQRE